MTHDALDKVCGDGAAHRATATTEGLLETRSPSTGTNTTVRQLSSVQVTKTVGVHSSLQSSRAPVRAAFTASFSFISPAFLGGTTFDNTTTTAVQQQQNLKGRTPTYVHTNDKRTINKNGMNKEVCLRLSFLFAKG